jgi:hypothetical protein
MNTIPLLATNHENIAIEKVHLGAHFFDYEILCLVAIANNNIVFEIRDLN